MNYQEFLVAKTQHGTGGGFEPTWLSDRLFDFQRYLVDWAIHQGRGALFTDCGTGKALMGLTWAENVRRHTGKPALVVAPLGVTFQLLAEAEKFDIDAVISRDGSILAGITITNYERLEKFDTSKFGGVYCDESSVIKAFDGQRRAIVTEFLRTHQYRLFGTATAAPNDYTELGTSSEALGYLGLMDMLSRFFVNKQRTADVRGHWRATNRKTRGGAVFHAWEGQQWRFKGHAEEPFWRWVSSWARALRKPSDFGFDDGKFVLPPLEYQHHVVKASEPLPGTLFDLPAVGLHEERSEARRTLDERCELAADLIADADPGIVWCQLNDEAKLLTKLIDGAVWVSGSDSVDEKEDKLSAFSSGKLRHIVLNPKLGAFGLNWQHCSDMVSFPSHSYEQWYQSVRRCWRFGQGNTVTVNVVTSEGQANMLGNLQRKAARTDRMFDALVSHMQDALTIERRGIFDKDLELPTWVK